MLKLAEITIDRISQKCDIHIPLNHKCEIAHDIKEKLDGPQHQTVNQNVFARKVHFLTLCVIGIEGSHATTCLKLC